MDPRQALLTTIADLHAKHVVFEEFQMLKAAEKLVQPQDVPEVCVLLDAWHDLYRQGHVGWGLNLQSDRNATLPWVHVSARGRELLANASRDPANPAGYLTTIDPFLSRGSIGRSYLEEALHTYGAGLHRATAVLAGAVAESLLLDVRDSLVRRLGELGHSVPASLKRWEAKTIADGVAAVMDDEAVRKVMPIALRERFESHWPGILGQIRTTRNDAGHPRSVEPVTHADVHAGLLLLPSLARLARELQAWIATSYT